MYSMRRRFNYKEGEVDRKIDILIHRWPENYFEHLLDRIYYGDH